jgi:hypothetical protein
MASFRAYRLCASGLEPGRALRRRSASSAPMLAIVDRTLRLRRPARRLDGTLPAVNVQDFQPAQEHLWVRRPATQMGRRTHSEALITWAAITLMTRRLTSRLS